jgi:5'-methylthioadenosine phosphorylase
MAQDVSTGVIGGSGIYKVDGLKILDERRIRTPFGDPSDRITIGTFDGERKIAFLPRHGKGHRIMPSEINSRANIWALKSLGVRTVVSLSAVGSLKPAIEPRHIVIPNQLIDRTRRRESTFFGEGAVGHIQFGDPFCVHTAAFLLAEIRKLGYPVHGNETYVCMEGPAFSTRAESNLYRSWNAGVIGMTALPEAKLAREAEMCYAVVAFSTDYDCWHEEEVSVEMVIQNFNANIEKAKRIIREIVTRVPDDPACRCRSAAAGAIMTDKAAIPAKTAKKLDLLYGKYLRKK